MKRDAKQVTKDILWVINSPMFDDPTEAILHKLRLFEAEIREDQREITRLEDAESIAKEKL